MTQPANGNGHSMNVEARNFWNVIATGAVILVGSLSGFLIQDMRSDLEEERRERKAEVLRVESHAASERVAMEKRLQDQISVLNDGRVKNSAAIACLKNDKTEIETQMRAVSNRMNGDKQELWNVISILKDCPNCRPPPLTFYELGPGPNGKSGCGESQ